MKGHNGSRLEAYGMLDEAENTGIVENINSLHNRYAPKAYFFSHQTMIIKSFLTVIDHNHNAAHPNKTGENGETKYRLF